MGIGRYLFGILCIVANIHLSAQTCSLTVSSHKVCLGNSTTFNTNIQGGIIQSFTLDYGDGNTTSAANSVYTYLTPGTYTPSITVTFVGGATCNFTANPVTVYHLPKADFTILSPDTLCFAGNNLCIRDWSTSGLSNAPLNSFLWQLNNGFITIIPMPYSGPDSTTHCYVNTTEVNGFRYSILVQVSDTNGCIDRITKDSVYLTPKIPLPTYVTNIEIYCDSTIVKFTNQLAIPLSQVKKFRWVFGDGTSDTVNWSGVSHTYRSVGSYSDSLIVTDIYDCTHYFSDPQIIGVVSLSSNMKITPFRNFCYYRNEFRFEALGSNLIWEIFNSNNEKIAEESDIQFDFSFPNCGTYLVRLKQELSNCSVQKDSVINILGPRAIITNDTTIVVNSFQCMSEDTVYFKSPAPYLSCHHNNVSMNRIWDFGDAFAPPCTTDTENGVNVGMNCNYSKDSMQVKHVYPPGSNGCYQAKLYMKDPVSGCADTTQVNISIGLPEAGWDSSFSPPLPRLYANPSHPCLFSPLMFYFDRFLPVCGQERIWINLDSAAGKDNWLPIDTIERPNQLGHIYQTVTDSLGFVTVGIILKNGDCYDTTWYHKMFHFYPKDLMFDYVLEPGCGPYTIHVQAADTIQYNLKRATWSIHRIVGGNPVFVHSVGHILAPGDSIIHGAAFTVDAGGYFYLKLTLIDNNDCIGSYDLPISIGYSKDFNLSNPFRDVFCLGDSISLIPSVFYLNPAGGLNLTPYWTDTARSNAAKERLWWDLDDGLGFFHTEHTPTIKFDTARNYNIRLLVSDSLNCFDSISKNEIIKVVELKAAIRTLPGSFYCAPQVILLQDSSYIIDASGVMPDYDQVKSWYWDFGDNKPPSILQHAAHDFTSNGVFKVIHAIITNIGCTDTMEMIIDMKGPQPEFEIVTDTFGCEPYAVTFKNLTTKQLLSWTWYFGDNTVLPTTNDSDITHLYQAGIYRIRLQGVDNVFNPTTGITQTCSAFFPDTITNLPLRMVNVYKKPALEVLFADSVCPGQEVDFIAIADTTYTSFLWEFGNTKTFQAFRPDTTATTIYDTAGVYQVRISPQSMVNLTCIDTNYKSIYVSNLVADFEIDESKTPVYAFKQTAINGLRYEWDFGDPRSGSDNTSLLENPTHTFETSGLDTFKVCLSVYNQDFCFDSVCKQVILGAKVRIPNVFTPGNGDGFNDAFDIDIEGWTEFHIQIYNRWGTKVFESTRDGMGNDGINWNGRKDNVGLECASGVYYFILSYKLTTEMHAQTVHGTITLLRDE